MATARDAAEDRDTGADGQPVAETLVKLRQRSKATVRERVSRVRISLILAMQAGVAAGLSWFIAYEVLGNPEPVFAPIAAVGTLASSVGQRLRRTVELVFGVALGIAVGDLLILAIGTGPWQLGLIVLLSIIVAVFLGAGPGGVTQAAATAVLITSLSPHVEDLEFPRVVDALVGGTVGLLVALLLLPLNPLRIVERAARPALDALADELTATSEALRDRDSGRAQAALDRLRVIEEHMSELEEALEGGRETVTLAPVRWHRRNELTQYVEGSTYINHAVHNSGALVRRAVTLLEDEEPLPKPLPKAVSLLGEAIRLLRNELAAGTEPEGARERALRAVSEAGKAYDEGVGFSGSVVVAQVRTTASDLIRATGIGRTEANQMVRRAVGSHRATEAKATAGPGARSGAGAGSGDGGRPAERAEAR
nr:FUSC family protein [Micromonospora sp. DSM 115978]